MTREEIMARCEELDPIWQAMKEGRKFRLWDDDGCESVDYIISLHTGTGEPYETEESIWQHAEPIEPVLRVKQPVALMQALVDGGYKPDDDGDWWNESALGFLANMFKFCGQLASETKREWLPEWLEEGFE